MSKLTVSATTDFSDQFLQDISEIDFTNPAATSVTASFAAGQFAWGQINPNVEVVGSAGVNNFTVTGKEIAADQWWFQSWDAADRLTLIGTGGNDDLHSGSVSSDLFGGGGADRLTQGAYINDWATQRFFGGGGDDILTMTRGTANGGAGTDRLVYEAQWASPALSVDLSDGGGGRSIGGGLKVVSIESIDVTCANGNDTVTGGVANDRIIGMEGTDLLSGGLGDDSLSAGAGDNFYPASYYDQNDSLYGGDGNDTLSVNTGVADGGSGDDLLRMDASRAEHGMVLSITDGGGGRIVGAGLEISSIELLYVAGTNFADTIRGGASHDYIAGGYGTDVLRGNAGDDFLRAGTVSYPYGFDPSNGQNDSLYGGTGNDTLSVNSGLADGGDGIDLLNFDASRSAHAMRLDIADGGGGRVFGQGLAITEIERLDVGGTNFADRIRGGNFDDMIKGNLGADRLFGGDGNDLLIGGADDPATPGDGNDSLFGGAGDDVLLGGSGADIMTGGDGADRFAFLSLAELGYPPLSDVIKDFRQGHDKIDLSNLYYAPNGERLEVSFIGEATFYGHQNLEVREVHTTTQTLLLFGNGYGHGILGVITLDGVINLTGDDFLL